MASDGTCLPDWALRRARAVFVATCPPFSTEAENHRAIEAIATALLDAEGRGLHRAAEFLETNHTISNGESADPMTEEMVHSIRNMAHPLPGRGRDRSQYAYETAESRQIAADLHRDGRDTEHVRAGGGETAGRKVPVLYPIELVDGEPRYSVNTVEVGATSEDVVDIMRKALEQPDGIQSTHPDWFIEAVFGDHSAGLSERVERKPIAWLSRCMSGIYVGEFEVERSKPDRPPFNKAWGDWFPVYTIEQVPDGVR